MIDTAAHVSLACPLPGDGRITAMEALGGCDLIDRHPELHATGT